MLEDGYRGRGTQTRRMEWEVGWLSQRVSLSSVRSRRCDVGSLGLRDLHCKLKETTQCEVKIYPTLDRPLSPIRWLLELLSFMTVLPLLCAELLRGLAEVSMGTFHNPIPRIQPQSNPQASRIQVFFFSLFVFYLPFLSGTAVVPPDSAGSLFPFLPGTAACDPTGWRWGLFGVS